MAQLVPGAPGGQAGQGEHRSRPKRDLDQAELDLRYCDVVAEIDGVITRRNVNPGDNVQVGQSLMAIRSLNEIWVDANFKETQLGDLRIGQPVDLYVDMYGDRHVFKGADFRLHRGHRIDFGAAAGGERHRQLHQGGPATAGSHRPREYDPDKKPAVYRHSVVPYVYFKQPPTGPDAGKYFRTASSLNRRQSSGRNPRNEQMTLVGASLTWIPVGAGPWLVAATVIVPTFMEVLDTTIAVVALRYIAGGLSATVDDGEWVITSYLAANAIILPITGWLGAASAAATTSWSRSRLYNRFCVMRNGHEP